MPSALSSLVQLRQTCAFHPSLPLRGLGHCRSEGTLGIRVSVRPWRHCQRMPVRRCGGNLARKDPQQPPAGLPKHAGRAGAPGLMAASALPGPDSDSDGRTPGVLPPKQIPRRTQIFPGRSGTGASSRAVPKSGVRSDMSTNRTSQFRAKFEIEPRPTTTQSAPTHTACIILRANVLRGGDLVCSRLGIRHDAIGSGLRVLYAL